jgi:Cytochrome P450
MGSCAQIHGVWPLSLSDGGFNSVNHEQGDPSHTSFAASCINEIDRAQLDYEYRLEIIKDTAAVIFGGEHRSQHLWNSAYHGPLAGVDTLSAATETIFLALASFPEVVRKAQAEIDRVIGSNQLPEFEDRPNLPYVTAIVQESLRWQPATPIGGSRLLNEECPAS